MTEQERITREQRKRILSQRGSMAFWAIGLWLLLCCWSVAAFWGHINTLNPDFRTMAYVGALAGEFGVLFMIVQHCFSIHLNVRKAALFFGFVLSVVLLIHAGALNGLKEAEQQQRATEERMSEVLGRQAAQQNQGTKSQRERLANNRAAQKETAAEISGRSDKIKDSGILPRWYLDGWCYGLIFIVTLGLCSIVFYMMLNREDIDADYDGVADRLQTAHAQQRPVGFVRQGYQPYPATAEETKRPKVRRRTDETHWI